MCGRYAASRRPEDLVEEFEIDVEDVAGGEGAGQDPGDPSWNVAPTQVGPVVLERLPRTADETGGTTAEDGAPEGGDGEPAPPAPERQLRGLTWGLVPSWAKDRSGGARMINARAESLLEKPAYKRAALKRRCLIPADGWFEWQKSPSEKDAKGKPRKQPFFIHPAEGPGLAFAGLYEFWKDPDKDPDDPASWLVTYAVITTEAEPGLDVIHDRMPFVMPPERWADWLDPREQDPDTVRGLLLPPGPGRFVASAVSTRVNNVRNNGPELLEPLPVEELHGVVDPATGELIGAGEQSLF